MEINRTLKKIVLTIPFSVPTYMLARKVIAYPGYIGDYFRFVAQSKKNSRFNVSLKDLHPCLIDKTTTTHFEPHYIYHPAWAARIVANSNPTVHIDIGSTLTFSSIVSAFIPVDFYDYRPAELKLSNLNSKHADLTKLHFENNSIKSLSCMHTLEHIGLGRYGDPIDPSGDKKAALELARVLAVGGTFIFVTPMGKPKIAFNAHRVYSYQQVLDLFPTLKVVEFSMVPDNYKEDGLIINADSCEVDKQEWACGCFVFTK